MQVHIASKFWEDLLCITISLRPYVPFSSMPYAGSNVLKFVQTWTAVLSQQQMDDSPMLLTVNYMSGNDRESV